MSRTPLMAAALVAITATVYLINGEQDYYTSEVEILLDADAVSGSFTSPISLTAWTPMNCGFPSLAADGPNVHCVYQLDYDDGLLLRRRQQAHPIRRGRRLVRNNHLHVRRQRVAHQAG